MMHNFEDETYIIRGAIFEVNNVMGAGFLEAVYQECLEKEFSRRKIDFVAEKEMQLMYKNELLKQKYI